MSPWRCATMDKYMGGWLTWMGPPCWNAMWTLEAPPSPPKGSPPDEMDLLKLHLREAKGGVRMSQEFFWMWWIWSVIFLFCYYDHLWSMNSLSHWSFGLIWFDVVVLCLVDAWFVCLMCFVSDNIIQNVMWQPAMFLCPSHALGRPLTCETRIYKNQFLGHLAILAPSQPSNTQRCKL